MSDAETSPKQSKGLKVFDTMVVPTTKVLAIGRFTAKGTPEAVALVRPFEVRATIRSYLAGTIDQLFFQTESRGVVFIMNVATSAEAHKILEALPLGVAGLMTFELIPIGPLKPLALLLGDQDDNRVPSAV